VLDKSDNQSLVYSNSTLTVLNIKFEIGLCVIYVVDLNVNVWCLFSCLCSKQTSLCIHIKQTKARLNHKE